RRAMLEILVWQILHPRGDELIGLIPASIFESDPRSAAEQLDERYALGGGLRPLSGGAQEPGAFAHSYPGAAALHPVAGAWLREERIFVYPDAWVAIVQADGSFEVARMD